MTNNVISEEFIEVNNEDFNNILNNIIKILVLSKNFIFRNNTSLGVVLFLEFASLVQNAGTLSLFAKQLCPFVLLCYSPFFLLFH